MAQEAIGRSPYFVPPPPPPPPPAGPSPLSGLGTLALTLGVLVALGGGALLLAPKLLHLRGGGAPRDDGHTTDDEHEPRHKDAPPTPTGRPAAHLPILATDPVRGGDEALVTIVAFDDFQCPFCKRAEATLGALSAKYGDDLRIVWKDNPLPFHVNALPAAKAARVAFLAGGPRAFWAFHDRIFADQGALGTDLETWAKSYGVDAKASARWQTEATAQIDASIALAKEVGASGTPTFFVDGELLSGAQPQAKFEALIDPHLAEARKLVADGTARADVYAKLVDVHWGAPTPVPSPTVVPPPKFATIPVPAWAPSRGPRSAPVVIQVFGDFQCPFCARAMTGDFAKAVAAHSADVRVVFRHQPLTFHPMAEPAAELAIEAKAEKGDAGFWRVHDALYSKGTSGGLTTAMLDTIALAEGLSLTKVHAAQSGHLYKKQIDDDVADATRAGMTGTPSFLVGDEIVVGAQPESAFDAAIVRQLAKKGLAPIK